MSTTLEPPTMSWNANAIIMAATAATDKPSTPPPSSVSSAQPPAVTYKLNIQPQLPGEVADIAYKQGENPATVCWSLGELRNMIYERGEFEPDCTDDDFLIKFLRARFFKLEPSYTLLRNYHTFRSDYPEIHRNLDPVRLFRLGADDVVTVSPYKDGHQRRMMFFKFGNWQPARIAVGDIVAATLLLLELGSLEPVSQVMGGIGIFDFAGYSLSHMWYCSATVVQQVIGLIVTSAPQRTNEIHVINNGWVFDLMFRMFKPFLDERMMRKIHFHGSDLASLHRHIGPAYLPEVYGGVMPDVDYRQWLQSLTGDAEIMRRLEERGYVFDLENVEF